MAAIFSISLDLQASMAFNFLDFEEFVLCKPVWLMVMQACTADGLASLYG